MGIRVVKHLGSRSCPADDAKALTLVPTFPGEKVEWVNISAYFASGDDSSIDQPSELNWYGIFVPWNIAFSTTMLTQGGPDSLDTVAAWDTLFQSWVLETGSDGGEYYGGDYDATTPDKEGVAGEESHASGDEELIDSGPIGVERWFSREVVMRPYAAEGNNVIRFGDDFEARLTRMPSTGFGGIHIFGIARHEHAAQTDFMVELDDATAKEAFGLLTGGDYTKVQAMIEGNTGNLGDFIRTLLFGGDNYIESDTLKGAAGKGTVKMQYGISTVLSRRRRL